MEVYSSIRLPIKKPEEPNFILMDLFDEIFNIPELRYGAGIEYMTNNGFLIYWEIGAMSCLGEESQFIFGQTTIGLGYRFKCKK